MPQSLSPIARLHRISRRGFGATVFAATLAACGGGGGGGDDVGPVLQAPPTTAATLTQSGAEAIAGVQALHSGAAAIISKSTALDAGSVFAPLGASGSPMSLRNTVARAAREQALARQTMSCSDLQIGTCSGSVTFDYNFDGSSTMLPAGSYLAMTFNGLAGTVEGSAFSMSGTLRMDFLTAVDTASNFANARLQIELDDLSGTADGVSFGPESAIALYQFDANGLPTITIDGLRLTGLDNLNVIDADDYSAAGTRLRFAHWTAASTYVDLLYSSWIVSAGRPSVGSTATITAGTNGSAAILVTSASPTEVVYRVDLTVSGTTTRYLVSANLGTNPPTYTFTLAP